MGSLQNKRVVLGITGGIAAYKAADLTRRLRDAGAEVRVVMTEAATAFITPLTLQAVSGHPVQQQLLDEAAEQVMGHIELARWADVVLVAPASANSIAKLAHGRADDLLSTLCLAHGGWLAVAPAMNQQMWQNPATQANLVTLNARGVRVLGPASGQQACGEIGPGRMLEPVELVAATARLFATGVLDGLQVMVTAGPTWEPIDPVRGITNRSSGKMGYAIAEAASEAGASVTLVSGPVKLPAPERLTLFPVTTAQEMHQAVHKQIKQIDIFIGVAAVADYRVKTASQEKIKKTAGPLTLELERNPDILASVAAQTEPPFTVGFAAETTDIEKNGRKKLVEKGLDLIAINLVGAGTEGGFDSDSNQLLIIDHEGQTDLPMQPKPKLARRLIELIAEKYYAKSRTKNSRSTSG